MDHLPLPHEPTCRPPRVPYVCKQPYDKDNFFTYPERAGEQWHHATQTVTSKSPIPFGIHELRSPSNDDELAAFLQCWLFFGLLHAILGDEHYDQDKFCETLDGQKYVHTRLLEPILQDWTTKIPDIDTAREHMQDCLSVAHNIMLCLTPNASHDGFDLQVRTSLASLWSVLQSLADTHLGGVTIDGFYSSGDVVGGLNAQDKAHMIENGWCPASIARAEPMLSNVDAIWFLKAMRIVNPVHMAHRTCKDDKCNYEQIKDYNYAVQHDEGNCSCLLIGADNGTITSILERGQYPVIKIHGSSKEDVSMEVVERTSETPYVAISHVWADGLGNDQGNLLPSCQLLKLREHLEALRHRSFIWGEQNEERPVERKLHLWIDTLLVPVTTPDASRDIDTVVAQRAATLYQKALGRMRDVYEQASYVLVLDSMIQSVVYAKINPLEAAIRVHVSRWASRVWTYQEGALPEKILFQFADTAIDFREVAQSLKNAINGKNFLLRRLSYQTVSDIVMLRAYRWMHGGEDNVAAVFKALSVRRATEAKDQPVCAAALLNISVSEMVKEETLEARMCMFWELLTERKIALPSTIVFHRTPRLQKRGLRWAPAQIVSRSKHDSYVFGNTEVSSPATLHPDGLVVDLLPWRLQVYSGQHELLAEIFEHLRFTPQHIHARSESGEWYMLQPRLAEDETLAIPAWDYFKNDRDGRWHVLYNERDFARGSISCDALLGHTEDDTAEKPVFTYLHVLHVRKYDQASNEVAECAAQHTWAIYASASFHLCMYWLFYTDVTVITTGSDCEINEPKATTSLGPHVRTLMQKHVQGVFSQCWTRSKADLPQSESVLAAMDVLASQGNDGEGFLFTHIAVCVTMRLAKLDSWHDGPKHWIVD